MYALCVGCGLLVLGVVLGIFSPLAGTYVCIAGAVVLVFSLFCYASRGEHHEPRSPRNPRNPDSVA